MAHRSMISACCGEAPGAHLYIEGDGPGFPARDGVHRALKKTAFWAIFAFDTP